MLADRNRAAMQLTGFGLFLWLVFLHGAATPGTGIGRWHPHMHWIDKVAWFAFMAAGPILVGFLLGVAFANRRVFKCRGCGGKFDAEKMRLVADPSGLAGTWWCRKCNDGGGGLSR